MPRPRPRSRHATRVRVPTGLPVMPTCPAGHGAATTTSSPTTRAANRPQATVPRTAAARRMMAAHRTAAQAAIPPQATPASPPPRRQQPPATATATATATAPYLCEQGLQSGLIFLILPSIGIPVHRIIPRDIIIGVFLRINPGLCSRLPNAVITPLASRPDLWIRRGPNFARLRKCLCHPPSSALLTG